MTWIEKHGINCYSCNKLFDEREAIHVEIKNEDHEICEECAQRCLCSRCRFLRQNAEESKWDKTLESIGIDPNKPLTLADQEEESK